MLDITSVKIVTDSSADLLSLSDIPFAGVPLKIITSEKEYVDDAALDVDAMIADLATYQGKSSTACPSPAEWLSAFGDAQYVFCVSITSGLSGCCNAARIAKEDYENQYPDRRVFVLDSLSTGPEMQLLADKIQTLILEVTLLMRSVRELPLIISVPGYCSCWNRCTIWRTTVVSAISLPKQPVFWAFVW